MKSTVFILLLSFVTSFTYGQSKLVYHTIDIKPYYDTVQNDTGSIVMKCYNYNNKKFMLGMHKYIDDYYQLSIMDMNDSLIEHTGREGLYFLNLTFMETDDSLQPKICIVECCNNTFQLLILTDNRIKKLPFQHIYPDVNRDSSSFISQTNYMTITKTEYDISINYTTPYVYWIEDAWHKKRNELIPQKIESNRLIIKYSLYTNSFKVYVK